MTAQDLALAVRVRRGEFRLRQQDLVCKHLSLQTVSGIERGNRTPRLMTLGALDRVLRWPAGTAAAYYRNQDERVDHTMRDDAPEPVAGEHPADYIERVVAYLSEPDRRRMGEATAANMRAALTWLKQTRPMMSTPSCEHWDSEHRCIRQHRAETTGLQHRCECGHVWHTVQ